MTTTTSGDVETRTLSIHGLHVAMRIEGDGDPLLLINGMTRPLRSWEHFTGALSGRTVVSFDAPGVGVSPTPVLPLSIPGLAALAVAEQDLHGGADLGQHAVGRCAELPDQRPAHLVLHTDRAVEA